MNRARLALLFLPLLLLTLSPADAQPPRSNSERGRKVARSNSEKNSRPPPPSDRYLRGLRQRNPEEFERMRRLRREDPDAFRDALREKVRRRREGRRSNGRQKARPHPLREEIQAVRDAETEAERDRAVQALRERIGDMMEWQHERREKRIEHIRKQLRALEARHKTERENRDAQIDRHLQRILQRVENAE